MKKIFAILLVLALLLPLGVVAHAEETAEKKPFIMNQWGGFESDLDYVYDFPYFWAYSMKPGDTEGKIAWSNETDIPTLAENLKDAFDKRPVGSRYFMYCMPPTAFGDLAEDVVFVDKAVKVCQDWLEKFLKAYSAIGGKLDGIIIDVEFESLYATYIHSRYYMKDPTTYNKIVNNPLYAKEIRPALVERGFKFYPNPNESTPEIYGIHPNSGDEYAQSRAIWDAVLRSYINRKAADACSPVWKYYPDAIVSDYQSKNIRPWLKELSDFGGVEGKGGNFEHAGNSCNENTYSVRPYRFWTDANNGPAYNTLPGYNKAVYENKTFNYFKYDANLFKNVYLAADGVDVSFWISHYVYNLKVKESPSMTPYYAETILHAGMLDPSSFMGYIIKSEVDAIEDQYDYLDDAYETSLQIVDDLMEELTRVVGYADRKPIAVNTDWNSDYMLSGMYANGKNYWRITPDTSVVSLEAFKTSAADPTFTVNGQTVTFPGGRIIEDGKVRVVGTCGYWVETAADVSPIITRSTDYFRTYPAYGESFEGFEAGVEYNYNNAKPASCWEMKKQGGGSGTVVAAGDGKALAIKGTFTAKNVKMPGNITAGDSYAEHQAWEVSATLPADLASDAEIILLNAANEKKKSNDGGIKIAGGKVYYTQDGAYTEWAGVTLAGGSKYTFVRELDFSDPNHFTSDYYIYGADGALVAKVMDIPMEELVLPVYSISIGCTKVAGEAVLLDDYKLYPTKVGYDFELYNAKTGIQVTETDKAQSGNVAYRFSWLNATNTEKSYTVMAAFYNGDTLVEEKAINDVKLAPNADGIITGVVENKSEGQTVKVYLRDNNPAEEVPAGTEETVTPATPKKGLRREIKLGGSLVVELWVIIIVIAGVLVLAAGAVIIIAAAKKKKTETPDAE